MIARATKSRLTLDQLQVPEPCHEPWDTMRPLGESRRHCESCAKAVVDLSTLSRTAAGKVLNAQGGPPCVRFVRDSRGRIMTREDIARRERRRSWLKRVATVAAAMGMGSLFNVGCGEQPPHGAVTTMPAVDADDVRGEPTAMQGEMSTGAATRPSTQPSVPEYTHTVGVIMAPPPVSAPPAKKKPSRATNPSHPVKPSQATKRKA